MKKLFIFAMVLAVFSRCGEEEVITKQCKCMLQISPALPIKFWLTGEESFNQKQICGVHKDCFSQPFNCDDQVKIQITDTDSTKDYSLRIKRANGDVVSTIPFVKTQIPTEIALTFPNNSFNDGLEDWEQVSGGVADVMWVEDTGMIKVDGGNLTSRAYRLYKYRSDSNRGWPPGNYEIQVDGINVSTGGSSPLEHTVIIQGSYGALVQSSGWAYGETSTKTLNFTLTNYSDFFYFVVVKSGSVVPTGQIHFRITEIRLSESPTVEYLNNVYSVGFTAEDEDICEEEVSLEIIDEDDVVVAFSDPIDFAQDHECTYLISYSNGRNYAGLVYNPITSPIASFNIRVPMDFHLERFPEEDEDHDLSNNETITLSSELKAQRLMETDFVPPHFIRGLLLILKHQTLFIDGKYWTKKDAHEPKEGSKRFSGKRFGVWLTEKDFVERNVV